MLSWCSAHEWVLQEILAQFYGARLLSAIPKSAALSSRRNCCAQRLKSSRREGDRVTRERAQPHPALFVIVEISMRLRGSVRTPTRLVFMGGWTGCLSSSLDHGMVRNDGDGSLERPC